MRNRCIIVAGTICPECRCSGLFKIEEGYRCEECLSYFDENKKVITKNNDNRN